MGSTNLLGGTGRPQLGRPPVVIARLPFTLIFPNLEFCGKKSFARTRSRLTGAKDSYPPWPVGVTRSVRRRVRRDLSRRGRAGPQPARVIETYGVRSAAVARRGPRWHDRLGCWNGDRVTNVARFTHARILVLKPHSPGFRSGRSSPRPAESGYREGIPPHKISVVETSGDKGTTSSG